MIEIMVALVILSFISMSGYALLNSSNIITSKQMATTSDRNDIRATIVQITQDIQQAQEIESASGQYVFIQADASRIKYYTNNKAELIRQVESNGNVVENVTITKVDNFNLDANAEKQQFTLVLAAQNVNHDLIITRRIMGNIPANITNYGNLSGQVSDKDNNQTIEAAVVMVINNSGKIISSSSSDSTGRYELILPVGNYRVEAHATGYISEVKNNINIQINQELEEDFKLKKRNSVQSPIMDDIEYLIKKGMTLFSATSTGTSSNPSISLSGSTCIKGTVGTNAEGPGSIEFTGNAKIIDGDLLIGAGGNANDVIASGNLKLTDIIPNGTVEKLESNKEFTVPVFPAYPNNLPNKGVLETPWIPGEYYPILENGYYDKIEASGGRTITIDMAGGDRIIRVKDLNISQGNVVLINKSADSKLHVFVEESFQLEGSSKFNQSGSPSDIALYYAGGSDVNLSGNTEFKGNVFIEKADLVISGSGGIQGHIVSGGSKVDVTGNADAQTRLLYAPNATINISGSGKVKGTVVGKNIDISGGSCPAIDYGIMDVDDLPHEFFSH